jgi:hypothetical protein
MEEIRTCLDMQNAIIRRAKPEDTTAGRADIKEKLNTAYQFVAFEKPYSWSGKSYPLRLRAKYTTGTITVTEGSDQITGASTVWTQNAHEGSKIRISGSNVPYKILRVGSTTTITMSAPWTGSTASSVSYSIYKDEYGLYPDCQAVRKVMIPGLISRYQPIQCGPTEMDDLRLRYPFREGTPRRFTQWGMNNYNEKTWATFNLGTDFWEDDYGVEKNSNLIVWPGTLTTDTIATVRYTAIPPGMDADDDEPLLPFHVRPRLVYHVLKEHFTQQRDKITRAMWKSENEDYKKLMAGDIESTDEELVLTVDRRTFSRQSAYAGIETRDTNDST